MNSPEVFDPARAAHPFDASMVEAHCTICGDLAAHEVTEAALGNRVERSGYLCCGHFSWIVEDCTRYPFGIPNQRNGTAPAP